MKETVYILCALTCFVCAWLLFKGYKRRPSKLLLWSAVCFCGLTVNNVMLGVDFAIGPVFDLTPYRNLVALGSLSLLLYGLVWDVV